MGTRILIIGSGVAGYTAALSIAAAAGKRDEVVVLSRRDDLLFKPSLIWVPFGYRDRAEISFPLHTVYAREKIAFEKTEVTGVDLLRRLVRTAGGERRYDYLMIATGAIPDLLVVPGLYPERHAHVIAGWDTAERARFAFEKLLIRPGPVVIAALQGASSFAFAYELLLNLVAHIDRANLGENVPITFITAEPYVGHLGMGGLASVTDHLTRTLARHDIQVVTGATVKAFRAGVLILEDGRHFPFNFSMVVPPMIGASPISEIERITDSHGFVRVNDYYFAEQYPEVFACGSAIAVHPVHATDVPCAVPRTGYFAERTARVAAHNLVAGMTGRGMTALPPAEVPAKEVLDAGTSGLILLTDHLLEPRDRTWVLPGPEAHWAKVFFEKLYLVRRAHGKVKKGA